MSTGPTIPHAKSRALVIGIILVIVLGASIAGVYGYMYYQNNQQQVQHAAEQTAANSSPDQLSLTCTTVTTDTSTVNTLVNPPTGYATISAKFGVKNPTSYAIDAIWNLKIIYSTLSITIQASSSFHMAAKDTAYAVFPFRLDAQQLVTIGHAGSTVMPTFTMDASYSIVGTYSTYQATRAYDSTSTTGSGNIGSSLGSSATGSGGTLPTCP